MAIDFPQGGAATVFRDFEINGNPASPAKHPDKFDIRVLLAFYEAVFNSHDGRIAVAEAASGNPAALAQLLNGMATTTAAANAATNSANTTAAVVAANVVIEIGGIIAHSAGVDAGTYPTDPYVRDAVTLTHLFGKWEGPAGSSAEVLLQVGPDVYGPWVIQSGVPVFSGDESMPVAEGVASAIYVNTNGAAGRLEFKAWGSPL